MPELHRQLHLRGATTTTIEADLADPASPALIFDMVEVALGKISAQVLAHCESVASGS